MTSNDRKRKHKANLLGSSKGGGSVKFLKTSKVDPKKKKPDVKTRRSSTTSQVKTENSLSRDEVFQELQVITDNNKDLFRDLQSRNEEVKEAIARASAVTEALSDCGSRITAVEQLVRADWGQKLESSISKIKKSCDQRIDARLHGLASHIQQFFMQEQPQHFASLENSQAPENLEEAAASSHSGYHRSDASADKRNCVSTASSSKLLHRPLKQSLPQSLRPLEELKLSKGSFTIQPQLTNQGYQEILQSLDFSNLPQLEALAHLDDRRNMRDINLFCDNGSYPSYKIDYVVRVGGTSDYVVDRLSDSTYTTPIISSRHASKLRLLEIVIARDNLPTCEDLNNLEKWKQQFKPPRFVYEIGQLFIRRKLRRGGLIRMTDTHLNIVVDVAKSHRSVWLVVRPGYICKGLQWNAQSLNPFIGLEGSQLACLSEDIRNLVFTSREFANDSYNRFLCAKRMVLETRCRNAGVVEIKLANMADLKAAFLSQ